ncbi:MAG: histidinol dehydrogenase, partial [Spirochaetaceae bacterium]|nr:histidinol dehydrogenase [Spirochaetaceae bacterium]
MQAVKKAAALPAGADDDLRATVAQILADVKNGGENALLDYERRFDNVCMETVLVPKQARTTALAALKTAEPATVEALYCAAARIEEFALKQKECLLPLHYESSVPGLELGHRLAPVQRCGCYVPAGRHPLPSSALMSVVTAKAAGVPYVAACSPPAAGFGGIHPAVLAALEIAGADEVFCMGGAQAIAAFAYGAGAVSPVDLIVGPGSRYVTEAKRQVLGSVGIDALAGPSEVLIIADKTARADFIACDLLAQAEHDPASKAVLTATDDALINNVIQEIARRLKNSPADDTTARAWEQNGEIYRAETLDEAAAFANAMSPEHLELLVSPQHEAQTI